MTPVTEPRDARRFISKIELNHLSKKRGELPQAGLCAISPSPLRVPERGTRRASLRPCYSGSPLREASVRLSSVGGALKLAIAFLYFFVSVAAGHGAASGAESLSAGQTSHASDHQEHRHGDADDRHPSPDSPCDHQPAHCCCAHAFPAAVVPEASLIPGADSSLAGVERELSPRFISIREILHVPLA